VLKAPTDVNKPVDAFMVNTDRLSDPKFGTYKYRFNGSIVGGLGVVPTGVAPAVRGDNDPSRFIK
jgi:hypothetical protein